MIKFGIELINLNEIKYIFTYEKNLFTVNHFGISYLCL